jgi:hypothetical protein
MKQDLTDIRIVLDRSGSMANIWSETINAYNTFLDEQKKQPGEATLKLVQFDDHYEPELTVKLQDAMPLNSERYQPRGMTALNDAIGRTIVQTGAELAAMNEADRPGRVILMILTDGLENASKEFKPSQIKEMIEHQQSKYSWMIVFLGANMDAQKVGSTYGISKGRAMTFQANSAGIGATMSSLNANVTMLRGTPYTEYACSASLGDYEFFKESDRQAQADAAKTTLSGAVFGATSKAAWAGSFKTTTTSAGAQ